MMTYMRDNEGLGIDGLVAALVHLLRCVTHMRYVVPRSL